MRTISFLCLMALATCSCTPIAKIWLGVKDEKPQSNQEISKWAKQHKMSSCTIYEMDTTFNNWINTKYPYSRASRKIFSQPLIVMYFNHDSLLSFNNNCGFPARPNIEWNAFGEFNTFPPQTRTPDSLYHSTRLSELFMYMKPVLNERQIQFATEDYLVVMYSKSFNRQSKKLISLIQHQYKAYSNKIIYVNNDDVMYYKTDQCQ